MSIPAPFEAALRQIEAQLNGDLDGHNFSPMGWVPTDRLFGEARRVQAGEITMDQARARLTEWVWTP